MKKLKLFLLLITFGFIIWGCTQDEPSKSVPDDIITVEGKSGDEYIVSVWEVPSQTRSDGSFHKVHEIKAVSANDPHRSITRFAQIDIDIEGITTLKVFDSNGNVELTEIYDDMNKLVERSITLGHLLRSTTRNGDDPSDPEQNWFECVEEAYEEAMDNMQEMLGPIAADLLDETGLDHVVAIVIAIIDCTF